MAKIVKKAKSKRKIKLESLATLICFLSAFLYLGSSIFLKSYNVSLGKSASEYEKKITQTKEEKEALRVEVEQLRDRDRILAQAKGNGLDTNQDNVVIISGEE